jgi:ABC-type spermidine/putrescine transport system permease subunit I
MKQTTQFAKRGSTLFLRVALLALGSLVGVLGAIILYSAYAHWNPEFPELLWVRWPFLLGLVMALLAFFVAAHQAWQLLNNVDKHRPFSDSSITALRNIKYAALVVGSVLLAALPLVYWIAQHDDAPGLIIFGLVFAGVPLTVGVFAGVLQQLIQRAVDLKAENDLTV